MERAPPKADSVNYEADEEIPPEPQNPPAATKVGREVKSRWSLRRNCSMRVSQFRDFLPRVQFS